MDKFLSNLVGVFLWIIFLSFFIGICALALSGLVWSVDFMIHIFNGIKGAK
jgi:hypothetical protein